VRSLLAAFALIGLSVGSAQAVSVDRIAAVVNDEVITLSEVYELGREFIDARAQSGDLDERRVAELEVLDTLIRRRLVEQTAVALQIDATDEDVDRAVGDIARRNGVDLEALRSEIERSGVSWQGYREEIQEVIREQKFTQMLIRPRIVENEDELRDAYRRMLNGAEQPVRVHLGAIFLAYPTGSDSDQDQTVALATKVRDRVLAGESFALVSAEVDQGPYGANGGTMGTFSDGELVGELNVAAFSTGVGEVSKPVVTSQVVFLLEVRKREKIPVRPYEEVRDQISSKVFEGRIEREKDAWYQQARREAAVVIKLKEPQAK